MYYIEKLPSGYGKIHFTKPEDIETIEVENLPIGGRIRITNDNKIRVEQNSNKEQISEPEQEDDIWSEIAAAIREGVNEA